MRVGGVALCQRDEFHRYCGRTKLTIAGRNIEGGNRHAPIMRENARALITGIAALVVVQSQFLNFSRDGITTDAKQLRRLNAATASRCQGTAD